MVAPQRRASPVTSTSAVIAVSSIIPTPTTAFMLRKAGLQCMKRTLGFAWPREVHGSPDTGGAGRPDRSKHRLPVGDPVVPRTSSRAIVWGLPARVERTERLVRGPCYQQGRAGLEDGRPQLARPGGRVKDGGARRRA